MSQNPAKTSVFIYKVHFLFGIVEKGWKVRLEWSSGMKERANKKVLNYFKASVIIFDQEVTYGF